MTMELSERSARRRVRAHHTKSLRGCFTRKARRVKVCHCLPPAILSYSCIQCDEIKPICGACELRESPATGLQNRHDPPDQLRTNANGSGNEERNEALRNPPNNVEE
jgi:hypothetical protein